MGYLLIRWDKDVEGVVVDLENDLFELDSEPSGHKYEGWQGAIADFFEFDEYRATFRIEILAGLTTFMTMAYILVVNPLILSNAIFLQTPKDLFAELVFSTAVSAAIGTLVMALLAKYPFAIAPGMHLNRGMLHYSLGEQIKARQDYDDSKYESYFLDFGQD